MSRRVAFPPLGILSAVANRFLFALGVEPLTPPPTTRRTLDIGVKGFDAALANHRATSFECKACLNLCEIAQIRVGEWVVARWGGRCDRWEVA